MQSGAVLLSSILEHIDRVDECNELDAFERPKALREKKPSSAPSLA